MIDYTTTHDTMQALCEMYPTLEYSTIRLALNLFNTEELITNHLTLLSNEKQ